MIDPADKADLDNDAAWLDDKRAEHPCYCGDGTSFDPEKDYDHSWTRVADEPDVGFHGYRECKNCGKTMPLDDVDYDDFEGA